MEAWMKGSTEGRKQPNYVVTAARRTVYADIWHFLQDHDSPATVYEVCDAVGLNVSYRLKALPRKGHPQGRATRPHTAEERRSWHPALHIDTDALRGKVSLPSQVGATVLVPVCGRIPGGPLNLANQAVESAFLLDKQPIGEGTLFMLKVTGDSMINAGIADGNWVVVRQQAHAQTGEIVVAMIGGEATVKTLRYDEESGLLELVPQNPDYQPIPGDEATILGKVVGVVCQA
jgi:repressor LexA